MAKKKNNPLIIAVSAIICITVIGAFVYSSDVFDKSNDGAVKENDVTYSNGENTVHFVDCGQGDCEIIMSEDKTVVIDTGDSANEVQVMTYFDSLNIDTIDYMVISHPHADHIGNASQLIEKYGVGTLYMRKPTENTSPTTRIYENLLDTIEKEDVNVKNAMAGDTFSAGEFNFEILAPLKNYTDLNDQSVVLKGECQSKTFLFEGDASIKCERDMRKFYAPVKTLDCDVLKVGHHGSKYSSCDEFISTVTPEISIISCGLNNSYGHPHQKAIEINEKYCDKLLRTDVNGSTIVTVKNGKLSYESERE